MWERGNAIKTNSASKNVTTFCSAQYDPVVTLRIKMDKYYAECRRRSYRDLRPVS